MCVGEGRGLEGSGTEGKSNKAPFDLPGTQVGHTVQGGVQQELELLGVGVVTARGVGTCGEGGVGWGSKWGKMQSFSWVLTSLSSENATEVCT